MMSFRPNESLADHKSVFKPVPQGVTLGCVGSQAFQSRETDAHSPTPDQLMALAKRLYSARARRADFISSDLFGEPGWDMLLALFNAESGGRKLTVSSLCAASLCPDTTALRWIDRLVQLALVRRVKSPLDARVIFVELQPVGRTAINSYLRELWGSLFSPA